MKLRETSILLLSDMPEVHEAVQKAIGPLVKHLLIARNTSEAVSKAKNSRQDAVLLRTSQSHFLLGDNFWNWCQSDRSNKSLPWILLDEASEPAEFLKQYHSIRVCSLANPESIIHAIEGAIGANTTNASASASKVATAPQLINLFVGAALELLKSKGGVTVSRGDPFVRLAGKALPSPTAHASQIKININGKVASLMVRFPTGVLSHLKLDAGELAKLIFHQATEELKVLGFSVLQGPSTTNITTASEAEHSVAGPSICVPFETGHGPIFVECVVPT
jgi:hypothetical protein